MIVTEELIRKVASEKDFSNISKEDAFYIGAMWAFDIANKNEEKYI